MKGAGDLHADERTALTSWLTYHRRTLLLKCQGLDADRVVQRFATSHNITIDGGRGPTKGKIFRIGHMGYVDDFDVTTALAALEQVLHELGHPVDFGASLGAAQKVFAERG